MCECECVSELMNELLNERTNKCIQENDEQMKRRNE